MSDQEDIVYLKLGTYQKWEAELLLNSLVEVNIRFKLSENSQALKQLTGAGPEGLYGHGAGTDISIHPDDMDMAMEIQSRVFKLEVSKDEKENLYEEIVNTKPEFPLCPKCSSVNVVYDATTYRSLFTQFFIVIMPWLWDEKKWHCRNCYYTWETDWDLNRDRHI